MYLCLCKDVTERDVEQVARTGTTTPEALIGALGLDDDVCCGRCALEIEEFVAVAEREWSQVGALHPS
jgi:bacterioferritin-associated ferredoxin